MAYTVVGTASTDEDSQEGTSKKTTPAVSANASAAANSGD